MILLVGPFSGVDFSSTSFYFRANIEDLAQYIIHTPEYRTFDFGIGEEKAFKCCGCKRFTPLMTGSVDHIVPRSIFQIEYLHRPGEFYDSVTYRAGGKVKICVSGKIQVIAKTGHSICETAYSLQQEDEDADIYMVVEGYERKPILLKDALINDMQNLQLMCSYCNSSKGNRT